MTTGNPSTLPTVDVVIPVFNGQDYILEAIASVQNQTLQTGRIIVVDDGSTDHTAQRVQDFRGRIPIHYIRKANGGLSSARNAGIKASEAEFIAFLDADDAWYPHKLEKQVQVFQTTNLKNLAAVYCQYETIDASGAPKHDPYHVRIHPEIRGRVFQHILPKNLIAGSGSGVLVRRACFTKVGLFDENLLAVEDWDMWLRLAQEYAFDYVDEILVKIRRHDKSMQSGEERMFASLLTFYNKWIPMLSAEEGIPSLWVRTIVASIFSRFPRRDFYQLFCDKLSTVNQKKVTDYAWRHLKFYFLLRIALLPVLLLKQQKSNFQ